ncbi:MAG: aminotransferase class I/II-fold pyridoxal phosphate-dependent enzyme [Clostridia bacterium]|nr:aminotransferase class I/II-fold pyridoxal phosphate-dependent enzyme [Clostridia bacterium]
MSERFLSPRVTAVPPSGIRRFFDIAGTMKGAISLGVGEPDFVTPYHIRNAAMDSLLDGETQYTPNRGLLSLRTEIAGYLSRRYGTEYDPETEILVTVGASEAIDLILRAIIEPGDEVLVPDPCYVSYAPCVTFAGGEPVPLMTDAENGFRLTPDLLEQAITEKTKALIFPYPNNPTGAVMRREHLEAIIPVIERHDLLVISDEIYSELTYDGDSHVSIASLPGMRDRTVLINGFSKAFAMTGWRLGYACADKALIGEMNKIHQYAIMCAPRQSQVAAEEALRTGRENGYRDIVTMRDSYDQRRRLMVDAFRQMGLSCHTPEGAFYCFPSIRETGLTSEEFCTRLLRTEKVVCVPGPAFGPSGEGHIRCCYATGLKQLNEAFTRIEHFIRHLGD